MTDSLKGKIALVTGASRGIGAATAEALAREGAHVIITARTVADLEAVEDRIHQGGGSATIAPMDVTDAESVGRLAAALGERWGHLDILVINAAMLGTLGPVQHIDPKQFAILMTTNVSAPVALIAAFDPLLRRSDRAHLIGITSSVGAKPRAFWGAYGASKAALDTLLGAYAAENANIGRITVAIVDPGATRTRMRASAYPGEDPANLKTPAVVADSIVKLIDEETTTGVRIVVNQ